MLCLIAFLVCALLLFSFARAVGRERVAHLRRAGVARRGARLSVARNAVVPAEHRSSVRRSATPSRSTPRRFRWRPSPDPASAASSTPSGSPPTGRTAERYGFSAWPPRFWRAALACCRLTRIARPAAARRAASWDHLLRGTAVHLAPQNGTGCHVARSFCGIVRRRHGAAAGLHQGRPPRGSARCSGICAPRLASGPCSTALWLAVRPVTRRVGLLMFGGVAIFGACTVVFGLTQRSGWPWPPWH